MSNIPPLPECDGFLTITIIGREIEVDAFRASTLVEYGELCRKTALEEAATGFDVWHEQAKNNHNFWQIAALEIRKHK